MRIPSLLLPTWIYSKGHLDPDILNLARSGEPARPDCEFHCQKKDRQSDKTLEFCCVDVVREQSTADAAIHRHNASASKFSVGCRKPGGVGCARQAA